MALSPELLKLVDTEAGQRELSRVAHIRQILIQHYGLAPNPKDIAAQLAAPASIESGAAGAESARSS